MLEMAKAAGTPIKRVAMMHEDGNFGTTMGNHVEAFAARLGYELVQRVPYSLRSPDFTAELSKVKAARPDLLVISGYYGDSKIIAETAAKLRIGVHALVGLANAAYSNPQVHRREPRADRSALRRQLLAQPAERAGPRGVRRVPEALQLDHVQPRGAGLPGDVRAQGRAGAGRLDRPREGPRRDRQDQPHRPHPDPGRDPLRRRGRERQRQARAAAGAGRQAGGRRAPRASPRPSRCSPSPSGRASSAAR